MTLGGLCGEERRAGLALLVGFAGQAEVGKARGGWGVRWATLLLAHELGRGGGAR
jgi:hypothetical protein